MVLVKLPECSVWRLHKDSVESDTFMEIYGKVSLEIVWDFHREKNGKSNCQTISILILQ